MIFFITSRHELHTIIFASCIKASSKMFHGLWVHLNDFLLFLQRETTVVISDMYLLDNIAFQNKIGSSL